MAKLPPKRFCLFFVCFSIFKVLLDKQNSGLYRPLASFFELDRASGPLGLAGIGEGALKGTPTSASANVCQSRVAGGARAPQDSQEPDTAARSPRLSQQVENPFLSPGRKGLKDRISSQQIRTVRFRAFPGCTQAPRPPCHRHARDASRPPAARQPRALGFLGRLGRARCRNCRSRREPPRSRARRHPAPARTGVCKVHPRASRRLGFGCTHEAGDPQPTPDTAMVRCLPTTHSFSACDRQAHLWVENKAPPLVEENTPPQHSPPPPRPQPRPRPPADLGRFRCAGETAAGVGDAARCRSDSPAHLWPGSSVLSK